MSPGVFQGTRITPAMPACRAMMQSMPTDSGPHGECSLSIHTQSGPVW